MICDLCGKNEASVHLTEIIDDQTQELHLCQPCAKEKGVEASQEFPAQLFGAALPELLAGLADFGVKLEAGEKAKLVCSQCGMTYDDFRKSGRLGCGNCYKTLERYLAPLLKRIHSLAHHVGKTPAAAASQKTGSKAQLTQLKECLRVAVAAENFEEAVRLRDQIRAQEQRKERKEGKAQK